jgi:CelD/BcsL family acetyltransferase involved in cellulose biosynthesis
MHASPFTPLQEYDRDAWRDFIDRSSSYPLPCHPDVLGWSIPDGGDALVYADRIDGEVRTMAVLAAQQAHAVDELPWLGQLTGWRLVGSRLGGRADDPALERFASACHELLSDGRADFVFLEDVEVDSPLWRAVSDLARRHRSVRIDHPKDAVEHWRVHFPDPPEDYWKSLSSSRRNSVRRKAKRFDHRVDVVDAPDQVPAFLEAARAIAEQSWQGKRLGLGVATEGRVRASIVAMAELGALRSYLLHHEDEPVAFIMGWQWQDVYQYQRPGYDQRYAGDGPGAILLYRMIEDLITRRTPAVLDFGYGHAQYKSRFATDHVITGPIAMHSTTLRSRTALTLRRVRDTLDSGVRGALRRTGLYDRVRRVYRRL